tara:strand:+ start:231 stop:542 length:312 start_codon:yes stop_codon:yes gene_type:complete
MNKEKDLVVQIMNEWYKTMEKNNITVQPKASTILGTILAKHLNEGEPDVFDKYMNTKAGELEAFYQTLSNSEKAYIEEQRQALRDRYYAEKGLKDDQKTLLKG